MKRGKQKTKTSSICLHVKPCLNKPRDLWLGCCLLVKESPSITITFSSPLLKTECQQLVVIGQEQGTCLCLNGWDRWISNHRSADTLVLQVVVLYSQMFSCNKFQRNKCALCRRLRKDCEVVSYKQEAYLAQALPCGTSLTLDVRKRNRSYRPGGCDPDIHQASYFKLNSHAMIHNLYGIAQTNALSVRTKYFNAGYEWMGMVREDCSH